MKMKKKSFTYITFISTSPYSLVNSLFVYLDVYGIEFSYNVDE